MPAEFSVLLLTAGPPGQVTEAGGAFVKIDAREVLLKSVELFLNRDNIKQIQLVINPDDMDESKRKFGGHLSFSGAKMVSGGPKWIDQIVAGSEKLSASATHVIVHDAARPAVAYSDIDCVTEVAEKHAVIALTAPLRSSLVELDEGHNPVAMHLSNRFVQLLTPQVFSREKFLAMAKSRQEPHPSEYHLEKGSPLNVRVGGSGDASLVRQMISMLPKPKLKAPSSPFEEAQW